MKKLIFKNGIHKIIFPVMLPIGDWKFNEIALKSIEKIQSNYYPRKNVTWDFTCRHSSMFAEVTVDN